MPKNGTNELAIEGDIAAGDCLVRFKHNGRVLAVASIFPDAASLEAVVTIERGLVRKR